MYYGNFGLRDSVRDSFYPLFSLLAWRMFFLSRMTDTVRISPDKFNRDLVEALTDAASAKFANKVSLSHYIA